MTQACKANLVDVVCEVLEQQVFMFGDQCLKEELQTDATAFLHTTMDFEGPVCGSVGVVASADLCIDIAANMLAIEPEDDFAIACSSDVIKEFLNVVCGQLLTVMYGSEPVFNLSIPEIQEIGVEAWRELIAREDTVGFTFDEEPAMAYLSVKERAE